MKKRCFLLFMILAFLILLFPLSGFASEMQLGASLPVEKGAEGYVVVKIQERLLDLGYIHFRPTGYFGDLTANAVFKFQEQNNLPHDGILGETSYLYLFSSDAVRAPINASIPRVVGPGKLVFTEPGILADWNDTISTVFPVGASAVITDYNTGKTFQATRTGGIHHAEISLSDSDSKKALLASFGGAYTWEKRAVVAEINGTKYAASLFGMPNANESFCLYFLNSTSDIGIGIPDEEHNDMVRKANGQ